MTADSLPDGPALALPVELRAGPFTTQMAADAGVSRYALADLVSDGTIEHPMRGVYYGAHHADSLDLRVACLSLVMPPGYVVTDRTAGWLWGVPRILAPGDHRRPPRVSAYGSPGNRLRNSLAASGERRLSRRDVQSVGELEVTTPVRTACDLGRLLHRDQALGAIDALLRHGAFDLGELLTEVSRFKRYRGVIQLRQLAPIADARAQSPQESILRLRWYDCGLPRPECQVEVPSPDGGSYFVDVGLPDLRFGAEYDGAEFHDEAARPRDESRRTWLTERQGWTLVVVRSANIHGREQDVHGRLKRGHRDALRRYPA